MTELGVEDLIALLAAHPGWRFFNHYGEEYVYDRRKELFRYDGWDCYNDCPDARIRNLRTPRRLLKRVEAPYMYRCATLEGNSLKLWTEGEWGEKDIPELALSVLEPVDAESIVQGNQTTET